MHSGSVLICRTARSRGTVSSEWGGRAKLSASSYEMSAHSSHMLIDCVRALVCLCDNYCPRTLACIHGNRTSDGPTLQSCAGSPFLRKWAPVRRGAINRNRCLMHTTNRSHSAQPVVRSLGPTYKKTSLWGTDSTDMHMNPLFSLSLLRMEGSVEAYPADVTMRDSFLPREGEAHCHL